MEDAKRVAEHIVMMLTANRLAEKETDVNGFAELIYNYGQEVKKLNIDDVSKNEAVCNCENEYWKEDESGDWYCTIHDKQA